MRPPRDARQVLTIPSVADTHPREVCHSRAHLRRSERGPAIDPDPRRPPIRNSISLRTQNSLKIYSVDLAPGAPLPRGYVRPAPGQGKLACEQSCCPGECEIMRRILRGSSRMMAPRCDPCFSHLDMHVFTGRHRRLPSIQLFQDGDCESLGARRACRRSASNFRFVSPRPYRSCVSPPWASHRVGVRRRIDGLAS